MKNITPLGWIGIVAVLGIVYYIVAMRKRNGRRNVNGAGSSQRPNLFTACCHKANSDPRYFACCLYARDGRTECPDGFEEVNGECQLITRPSPLPIVTVGPRPTGGVGTVGTVPGRR